jgi:hypothetical protein
MNEEQSFAEWVEMRADRIVDLALSASEQDREGWLRVQIRSLAKDVLGFSRAGMADDDPMSSAPDLWKREG